MRWSRGRVWAGRRGPARRGIEGGKKTGDIKRKDNAETQRALKSTEQKSQDDAPKGVATKGNDEEALAEEVAEEEGYVGGAFGEAAHEVGEPVAAERDVDAHAVTIAD